MRVSFNTRRTLYSYFYTALSGAFGEIGILGVRRSIFPAPRAAAPCKGGVGEKESVLMSDEKSLSFSDVLKEVVECLNQFKTPTLDKALLEQKGITTDLQNLPCTFNLVLKNKKETTRIQSCMKHILTERITTNQGNASNRIDEKYLTYVEVGIEHEDEKFFKIVGRLIVVVLCIAFIVLLGWLALQRLVREERVATRFSVGSNVVYSVEALQSTKGLK